MASHLAERASRWTPAARLTAFAAIGLALVASQALLVGATDGLTHETAVTVAAVMPLIIGLALPAAVALALSPRIGRVEASSRSLSILVVVGLAMRLVWFGQPAPLEDDYHRYLWDGAVLLRGLDPYALAPETLLGSPEDHRHYRDLAAVGRSTLQAINFPDVPTVYPSTALAAFAIAGLIRPFDLDAWRVVLLLAECTTLLLLVLLLRASDRSPLQAALYWWNPLPAYLLVGIAHVDALLPPLVLGALWLSRRGASLAATMTAMALLGAAAGVKPWALVHAPLLLRGQLSRPPYLVVAVAGLALTLVVAVGPLLIASLQPGSAAALYVSRGTNSNAFFAWAHWGLAQLTGDFRLAWTALSAATALSIAALAVRIAAPEPQGLPDLTTRMLIVAAATFYLLPQQFPWYAVAFLPLAALAGNRPLLLASATLPLYYLFFPLWQTGRGPIFTYGVAFLHALPVLAWLAWQRWAARHA